MRRISSRLGFSQEFHLRVLDDLTGLTLTTMLTIYMNEHDVGGEQSGPISVYCCTASEAEGAQTHLEKSRRIEPGLIG